ncbi:DeoR/GlpR family DNA-binding transcription regulator [Ornithinicoccus halotolerans]|uniref:DeoR/GlpR family DNA-binding transcription regulator n=1 Tax=Ornithinicoccus halotolerans TaxID=1748220 RepID=UPI001295B318|nr:DeoR/GlpR family DNA-binding transcription regulator [Ornithinicoccus halotolerans]
MRATDRRDEILRLVREEGYVNAAALAQRLNVDTSTVRRDLARLEQLGLVDRSHGGAIRRRDEPEVPYQVKLEQRVAEKEAIGRAAAAQVPDGGSVMLDSGSTTLMVARALSGRRNLTVVTADVRIAAELVTRPDVRLIVPGGESVPDTTTVVSQEAVELVQRMHVDLTVLGVDALDRDGATSFTSTVVPLKRAMIASGRRTVIVADSSKLGRRQLVRVASLEEVDEVITDAGADPRLVDQFPVPVQAVGAETEKVVR